MYTYVGNNPLNATDPTGKVIFGLAKKIGKLAFKGGDFAATFGGAISDAKTVFSGSASLGQRAGALASLATEIASPVSAREAKAGAEGAQRLFRGSKPNKPVDFDARQGVDFKVDQDGFVKEGRGLSVVDDPKALHPIYPVPNEINTATIPESLRVVQPDPAKPNKFEIVPRKGSQLTPEQFQKALDCIECK